MRTVLLASLLVILTCPFAHARPVSSSPNLGELQLVAQLPAELPQRVMGFAYDGRKFWATVYLGRGRYATLDPATLLWTVVTDDQQRKAISEVAGRFESPGAIAFVKRDLWVAGSYGESFGSIDTQTWKIQRLFKVSLGERAKQMYSSMAYDGSHLWIVSHQSSCRPPTAKLQVLLKVEPETGKVVAEYSGPPGTPNDATHGLAWDGSRLWHAKDNRLSAIDPTNGQVIASYVLDQVQRPSGLAWDGQALWIAQFDGKIWRLPFVAD